MLLTKAKLFRTLLGVSLTALLYASPSLAQEIIDGGQTVTVPGTHTSPWNINDVLIVGDTGSGTLEINGGGSVSVTTTAISSIGHGAGSVGLVTVSGPGSQWLIERTTVGYTLTVGDEGSGTLIITNGGAVTVTSPFATPSNNLFYIGSSVGGTGTVRVIGPGSQWNNSIYLSVGQSGTGTLEIADGGSVNSGSSVTIGFDPGSSGMVTVDGAGSHWLTSNSLTVGRDGTGTLEITNGGIVSSSSSVLGGSGAVGGGPDGIGTVRVSGAGSQWNNSLSLFVGRNGTGILEITDGGSVSSDSGEIGWYAGSAGSVIVSGMGSRWDTGDLLVGLQSNGRLEIVNGGNVSSTDSLIGWQANGTGMVTVRGAGSYWNAGDMAVGLLGVGTLEILAGGIVSVPNGYIAYQSGSSGTVLVDGTGSQWNSSGELVVGNGGNATLEISNAGHVSAGNVSIANDNSSNGVIAIGSLAASTPTAPGTLTATNIIFGSGDGRIIFNHTSSNYVFDATINGGTDNAAGSGTGLIGNGLVEAIAGRTILNADHGGFTGTLQVGGAGILQINGNISGGRADILTGGRLEGSGIVGSTVNAGTIAPGASIGTLTVAGNYTGNDGSLMIEAVLGGDTSPTDRLVINGNVSGSTSVRVTNMGGYGDQTINGIQIIQVNGASPGNAFALNGDYTTDSGQQAVIGGVYAYTLQHGGMQTPGDGHWYLVSELTLTNPETGEVVEGVRYQPGVPLYEQYPQVLAALNTVPTLQQRVGNRYWSGQAATGSNQSVGTYGMWGRVEGSRTETEAARSTTFSHRSTDLWKLQTGFDFVAHEGQDGLLVGGANVSYGTALSEIGSPYGRGKIDATGTGIGATLTWYGANGFYVDGQLQAMWFDSDITSMTIGRREVSGNNGHGLAVSGETGYRYQLGNGFSLTPQAQLVWSRVDFDSFTDPYGARVSLQDGDSLRGRLGLSLDYEKGWTAADGTTSRAHVYGIANLYNEFLDGSKVRVEHASFRSRDERLWAGLGLGGTYEWSNGRYAVYGNVNLAGSTSQMSDNHSVGGIVGFRASW